MVSVVSERVQTPGRQVIVSVAHVSCMVRLCDVVRYVVYEWGWDVL